MRSVFLLVIAGILCVALAWFVAGLPGMVSATISGTTIEASTPVAITLIALLFLILYVLLRLLIGLIRLPRTTGRWNAGRRRGRGEAAVTRALVALAANDGSAARREAERSRRLLGDTPLTLLLAAQAGRQAGRDAEADAAFRLLSEHKDARLLGLRGLLRHAMHKQDWPAATALASQAEAAHPGAAWLRDERRQLAVQTGQWREALRLSGPDGRPALAVAAANDETDPNAALRMARQAFEAEPGLAPASVAYATRLRQGGRERAALDVLRRAWSINPQPEIGEEFVRLAPDKLTRAQEAALLIRSNPTHPESYLLVARCALDAGLTTEARKQLEAARAAGVNQRRLWLLLADIAVMEGQADEAQEVLRNVPTASPDPVWRCGNCGKVHQVWHPVCDACEATGTIAWVLPDDPAPTQQARLPQPQEVEGLT